MSEANNDTAGVIALPPVIYAGGLVAGFLLHLLVPIRLLPPIWARFFGSLMASAGLLLGGFAFRTMDRAGTDPYPGHPTTAIVANGPFGYTRNPIYVSFTLLYVGIAALANSLTMLLPLPVVLGIMQRGVIEREERYLERKFGAEYTAYKTRVRRWL